MKDFTSFLEGLVGGETDATPLIRRKKNAPPTAELLPSHQAMQDVLSGASDAIAMHGGDGEAAKSSGAGGAAKGALGGLFKGIAEATKAQPMAPVGQIAQNPARENAIANVMQQPPPMQVGGSNTYDQQWNNAADPYGGYRGLRNGGIVRDGETVVVGEDGVETVTKKPDGEVVVNPEQQAKSRQMPDWSSVISSPMPNATQQTRQGDDREDLPYDGAITVAKNRPDAKQLVQKGLPDDLPSLYKTLAEYQTEKPSRWKDAGYGALQGLLNYTNHTNQPIQSYSAMRTQAKTAPIIQKIGQLEHQQEFQTNEAYKAAQTAGIPAKLQEQKDYHDSLEADRNGRLDIAKGNAQEKSRRNFRLSHPFFDPTKASDADKKALASFGETPESMGAYDFTKPNARMVGDTLMQWNAQTHSFEDSGLKDPNKSPVDFVTKDPITGVTETYSVPSEKAAALKVSLERQGMQIQSAERRQDKQIQAQKNNTETVQSNANYRTTVKSADEAGKTLVALDAMSPAKGESPAAFNARREAVRKTLYERHPELGKYKPKYVQPTTE